MKLLNCFFLLSIALFSLAPPINSQEIILGDKGAELKFLFGYGHFEALNLADIIDISPHPNPNGSFKSLIRYRDFKGNSGVFQTVHKIEHFDSAIKKAVANNLITTFCFLKLNDVEHGKILVLSENIVVAGQDNKSFFIRLVDESTRIVTEHSCKKAKNIINITPIINQPEYTKPCSLHLYSDHCPCSELYEKSSLLDLEKIKEIMNSKALSDFQKTQIFERVIALELINLPKPIAFDHKIERLRDKHGLLTRQEIEIEIEKLKKLGPNLPLSFFKNKGIKKHSKFKF